MLKPTDLTLLEQMRITERNMKPLCLVYFDVDAFKPINDTRGHDHGDTVLKEIAETLRMVSRNVDLCFRLGGDEDGLRISIGIVQTGPDMYDDPDALIRRADSAMYEAKRLARARALIPPLPVATIAQNSSGVPWQDRCSWHDALALGSRTSSSA